MSTISRRLLVALPAVPLVLWLAAVGCQTAEREEEANSTGAAATTSAAPSAATAEPTQTAAVPHPPVVVPPVAARADGGSPADAGAAIVDAGKVDAAAASDAGSTASAKLK